MLAPSWLQLHPWLLLRRCGGPAPELMQWR